MSLNASATGLIYSKCSNSCSSSLDHQSPTGSCHYKRFSIWCRGTHRRFTSSSTLFTMLFMPEVPWQVTCNKMLLGVTPHWEVARSVQAYLSLRHCLPLLRSSAVGWTPPILPPPWWVVATFTTSKLLPPFQIALILFLTHLKSSPNSIFP